MVEPLWHCNSERELSSERLDTGHVLLAPRILWGLPMCLGRSSGMGCGPFASVDGQKSGSIHRHLWQLALNQAGPTLRTEAESPWVGSRSLKSPEVARLCTGRCFPQQ